MKNCALFGENCAVFWESCALFLKTCALFRKKRAIFRENDIKDPFFCAVFVINCALFFTFHLAYFSYVCCLVFDKRNILCSFHDFLLDTAFHV